MHAGAMMLGSRLLIGYCVYGTHPLSFVRLSQLAEKGMLRIQQSHTSSAECCEGDAMWVCMQVPHIGRTLLFCLW